MGETAAPIPMKPQQEEEEFAYDFTPYGVDLNSFPYHVWRKLSREILMDDRTELFRSGDSQGEYEFRSAVCRYLHQARGVNCAPKQVIVGAGKRLYADASGDDSWEKAQVCFRGSGL